MKSVHRPIQRFLFLVFTTVFLTQGALLSCLTPSINEVAIAAIPPPCCTKDCPKAASKEDVQAACRITAVSENYAKSLQSERGADLSSVIALPAASQIVPVFSHVVIRKDDGQTSHQTIPRYILFRTFLI
jgi:hypothetical protein